MNVSPRLMVLLGTLAAAPLLSAADSAPKPPMPEPNEPGPGKFERRVFIRHRGGESTERETVAFLGVETAPVTPALTAQLSLPKNVGLVVRQTVDSSPAVTALQRHDILLKLDDQWLVDARQFSVLVRNHKPGDEVTVTYVRGGKQDTVKVKLSQHDVPKFSFDFGREGAYGVAHPFPGAGVRHMLPLLKHGGGTTMRGGPATAGPGIEATTIEPDDSNMVFTDDNGVLELTTKDGKKLLVAKTPKGDPLFSGPIDTPEQRAKLPDSVRKRLDEIEAMRYFSFEPGPGFQENLFFASPDDTEISLRTDEAVENPPAAL